MAEDKVEKSERRKILEGIFSAENRKVRSEVVNFYGQKIEIRQAKVRDTLELRDVTEGRIYLVEYLINYAYVPGTDERVFEEAHREQLETMPTSSDWNTVAALIAKLSNFGEVMEEQVKN